LQKGGGIEMNEIKITKRPHKRGDDGHKIISLRIGIEMLDKIEKIAHKTDRSRNELINILLAAALENVVVEE